MTDTPGAHQWNGLIATHAALALGAVLLGAWMLRSRKGQRAHRIWGWVWVLSMAAVATLSFAIVRPQGFSWIHGLSVFTLFSLCTGIWAARTHRVAAHRINMISLYVGALIITGLFTLLPGRLIGHALWSMLGAIP